MTSADGPRGDALAAGLEALDFSGVVRVEGPDGLLAEVALGIADRSVGRPMTASSRLGVASIGKLFTAVALVREVERGTVTLATPLAEVLPPDRRPRDLHPGVTLEHLLTHTSGIADYADEYLDEPYGDLWLRTNPATVREPRDLLPLFADLPRRADPGVEVRYNNGGIVLAGLALEAITGRSFYDVIEDAVLRPAGMTSTGYPAFDDVIPDLAIGYLPPPDDAPDGPWRTNVYAMPARGQPDGGPFSTARDLVAFLDAFAAGRLVGEAWRDEMLRPRADAPEEEVRYGLTWWLGGEGDLRWYGHPGGDPGYVGQLRCYPASGTRVAVLANRPARAWKAMAHVEATLVAP